MNYWEAELSEIKTTGERDAVKVKFQTMHTDTKWLTLRPSEFEAIEALMVELYAAREEQQRTQQADRAEFQAKWDYVESHNLMLSNRKGFVVTLEDKSTGAIYTGNSLSQAIQAHRQQTAPAQEAPAAVRLTSGQEIIIDLDTITDARKD